MLIIPVISMTCVLLGMAWFGQEDWRLPFSKMMLKNCVLAKIKDNALRVPRAVLNRHFETEFQTFEAGPKLWLLAGSPVAGALQAEAAGQIGHCQCGDASAVQAVRRA